MIATSETQNDERIQELDRRIKLADIEKTCLQLMVGESKIITIDTVEYQRLRTRLSRIKSETGKDIRIIATPNGASITRYEDEPIN